MKYQILIVSMLLTFFAAVAQNSKYGLGNVKLNNSQAGLTDADVDKLVRKLWNGIPDHGMNEDTRGCLTESFYKLMDEGFAIPTDNPGGIGSEEIMYYWYIMEDCSGNISKVSVISHSPEKITAEVLYHVMGNNDKHTLVLAKEDGKWKIDDFDSFRKAISEYVQESHRKFAEGYHKQIMKDPEYTQYMSEQERKEYINEVERYLDRYVRKPQNVYADTPTVASTFGVSTANKASEANIQQPASISYSRPNLASVFDPVLNQYPEDVNIFDNTLFRQRLISLMGESRFNTMVNNFDYTYPIEKGRNIYLIMGCKRNSCGITDFEIQYNPNSNNLCVKYNVDNKVEIFMDENIKVNWHEYIDE